MAKRVMIVDDEENICTLVKELLEGEGYDVMTALGGQEALTLLKKSKPDLVLVDFFMPGMSGRELCEEIREDPKLRDLTLAFLTVAQFGKGGFEVMEGLGLADYIQKPFDNQDLIRRVGKMVERTSAGTKAEEKPSAKKPKPTKKTGKTTAKKKAQTKTKKRPQRAGKKGAAKAKKR